MEENQQPADETTAQAMQDQADSLYNKLVAMADKPVPVPASELLTLMQQNAEYKADIITLVSTFSGLEALFSGSSGLMGIIPVVTKLIKDPERMKQIAAIVPVMAKYKSQPAENEH